MTSESALNSLTQSMREVYTLAEVCSILHWDQETMMPKNGVMTRAAQLSELVGVLHEKRTNPKLKEWLSHVDDTTLSVAEKAMVREIQRDVDKAHKVPGTLLQEIAKEASLGHQIWSQARKEKNFSLFAPALERMVNLKKEYAKCLGFKESPYEVLLDDFEPGSSLDDVSAMLEGLRAPLIELLGKIKGKELRMASLVGEYPEEQQLALAKKVSTQLGYDFSSGRLDLAVHPFTSGGTPGDIRITTRVNPKDFQDCLYSTIHEVGHALYEQGINKELTFTPLGYAVSLGVHESQSRLWENQVSRGPFFSQWIYQQCKDLLGLGDMGYDGFYRAINEVGGSVIRTESDEVTYNLHVLLRFELEKALFEDRLALQDVEEAWNSKTKELLGFVPPSVDMGVLQDVHWSGGHFGYFPTYTLGNIYSAELFAAADEQIDDLSGKLSRGEGGELLAWLRENVHQHGRLYTAPELMARVCGHQPTSGPLVRYLQTKFSAIYGLESD
jgi:carboxypeptidase Taq